jgi:hypothetical protein
MQPYVEVWKEREKRKDLRTARICAVLANCHRDKKKRPTPYTESDFMPREKRIRTDEELLTIAKAIFGCPEQQ